MADVRKCTAAVLCVLAATLVTAALAARKQSPLLEDNALPKKPPYRVTGTYKPTDNRPPYNSLSVDRFAHMNQI
jgi:hypothetical protein